MLRVHNQQRILALRFLGAASNENFIVLHNRKVP